MTSILHGSDHHAERVLAVVRNSTLAQGDDTMCTITPSVSVSTTADSGSASCWYSVVIS